MVFFSEPRLVKESRHSCDLMQFYFSPGLPLSFPSRRAARPAPVDKPIGLDEKFRG